MITTFAAGQDEIVRRVKQFQTNFKAYHAPDYKEAHARQELIDWLFIALGWDVRNERGAAPHRREVILEASQEVEGHAARKAPDYAFRFGVETLLQLHPRLATAKSAHDRDLIQRQIDATDQQIDALVYQLYSLTEEEIKIVEGNG